MCTCVCVCVCPCVCVSLCTCVPVCTCDGYCRRVLPPALCCFLSFFLSFLPAFFLSFLLWLFRSLLSRLFGLRNFAHLSLVGCLGLPWIAAQATHSDDGESGADARLVRIPGRPSIPAGTKRPIYWDTEDYPRHVGKDRGAPPYFPKPGQNLSVAIGFIPEANSTYSYFEATYVVQPNTHTRIHNADSRACSLSLLCRNVASWLAF